MARKIKPCEFCEDDSWTSLEGKETNGHQLAVEMYPFNGIIAITSFANNEEGEAEELQYTIPLNYCPNCGRKLEW